MDRLECNQALGECADKESHRKKLGIPFEKTPYDLKPGQPVWEIGGRILVRAQSWRISQIKPVQDKEGYNYASHKYQVYARQRHKDYEIAVIPFL